MVLNLIPVPAGGDPLADQDDILLTSSDRQRIPSIGEWRADQHEQTITHLLTGLEFRAFQVKPPLVDGLVLPFHRTYDIGVRLVGFRKGTDLPSPDRIREIGREGIVWISTFTYEASKR